MFSVIVTIRLSVVQTGVWKVVIKRDGNEMPVRFWEKNSNNVNEFNRGGYGKTRNTG